MPDSHDHDFDCEMRHDAEQDEAIAAAVRHCRLCGTELPEGYYIACEDCGSEYAARATAAPLPRLLPEPPYRRVAGAKVPLDELPDAADVS